MTWNHLWVEVTLASASDPFDEFRILTFGCNAQIPALSRLKQIHYTEEFDSICREIHQQTLTLSHSRQSSNQQASQSSVDPILPQNIVEVVPSEQVSTHEVLAPPLDVETD